MYAPAPRPRWRETPRVRRSADPPPSRPWPFFQVVPGPLTDSRMREGGRILSLEPICRPSAVTVPRPREGLGGRRPHAGGRGNRVAPILPSPSERVWAGAARAQGRGATGLPRSFPPPVGGSGRAPPARRGPGQPGCPDPSLPKGRVWAGVALPGTILRSSR